jgi:hypothetical protein
MNRKVKQVLSGGRYQWRRGEHKERVNMVDVFCYLCMKIE